MTNKPVITAAAAAAMVKDGQTLMVAGFLGVGTAGGVVAALVERGTKGLTLVTSDTGILDEKSGRITGPAALVRNRQVAKVMASHIGTNAETQRQMNAGEIVVELVPQGTLAERIRAAGAGLGGILTPTGVGTEVEEGKRRLEVDGKTYLLEEALRGDVALIKARRADRAGNLQYAKTARNFNPLMATACDLVIVEAEEIVEIGAIDPEQVHTPSIFVDYLVQAGK